MPVDKALLESCIAEAAGDDAEMATFLRERYSKNDALAAKFVGGYMRQSDYTKKTQELSESKKQFDGSQKELDALRKTLEAAEVEKNKIMRDLAGKTITVEKARAALSFLGEKYGLTDEDLPGMGDLIATRKTGEVKDTTDDFDTRLAAAKKEWMAEAEQKFAGTLIPELGSMAVLPIIWDEISREHQELTGKPLTYAEKQEIYKVAREGKSGGLRDVWEQKYNVSGESGLRMQKRDERLKAEWSSQREKDDADRRSREALEVVTPAQKDMGAGPGISAAFKTRFREYPMDPNQPVTQGADGTPTMRVEPGQHPRQEGGGHRVPARERAAAKFLERGGGTPGGYKKAS